MRGLKLPWKRYKRDKVKKHLRCGGAERERDRRGRKRRRVAQYRVTESRENCRSRCEESHERWRRENNPDPL